MIVWGDELPPSKPTLEEAVKEWCSYCQNTGLVRDPLTDKLSGCTHCHRFTYDGIAP